MNLLSLYDLTLPLVDELIVDVSSLHERCLTAVRARIHTLALPGLPAANVFVRKLPWANEFLSAPDEFALPGVIVSPLGSELMNPLAGTNLRDEVSYPVFISIVANDNQQLSANLGRYLAWRQRLARAFRHQPLPGVDEVIDCHVEPTAIVLPEAFTRGVFHSGLVVRCVAYESRV